MMPCAKYFGFSSAPVGVPPPQFTQSHIRSIPPAARYHVRTPSEKVLVRSVSLRTVFAIANAIAVSAAEIQSTASNAPPRDCLRRRDISRESPRRADAAGVEMAASPEATASATHPVPAEPSRYELQ